MNIQECFIIFGLFTISTLAFDILFIFIKGKEISSISKKNIIPNALISGIIFTFLLNAAILIIKIFEG